MKTILKLLIALAVALIATQALPKKAAYQGNQVAHAAQETQTPEPTVEPTPEATPAPTVAPTPAPTPIATVTPKPVVVAQRAPVVSGTHEEWMSAAGIPQADWNCANLLIMKESGWRVNAQNPSSSAYGIPQSLPGSKMASAGADWQTNPVTQLVWMRGYVSARYGGFCNAWSHSQAVNWY